MFVRALLLFSANRSSLISLARVAFMPSVNLLPRLLLRFVLGIAVSGAVLFGSAGSLDYWQAWAYLTMMFALGTCASLYLYKRDPRLIELRLQTKEKVPEQKLIMKLFKVVFLAVSVVPGLDHRFGWSQVPLWLTVSSFPFVLAAYVSVLWVMKVNRFASRIIEVQFDQNVISSGPYRIVRHPLYLGAVIMFLFSALALGSYWALPAFAMTIPFYVFRLLNEEKVLLRDLHGYSEYCQQTRYHLIPYVW